MFVIKEIILCTLKWPSLIAKNGKKSLFYEEKSLLGLTPEVFFLKERLLKKKGMIGFHASN